ncbi:MAG TPA: Ig-like domain-containing protein, partial [Pyrinomonadaceae bacterium]
MPVGFAATTTQTIQSKSRNAGKRQPERKETAPATQTARAQKAPPVVPSALTTSNITATKMDTIVGDSLGDGKAQAGDTIKYDITITNNSATDNALNVALNDTIDSNTTLVGDSIHAQPQARNDSYTTVGNTLLEVGVPAGAAPAVRVAGSAFDNDGNATDPSTFVSATQPANGTVTFNADGTFTYLPNAGFTGPTDSFTYTIRNSADSTLTDMATVTITITSRVWYVDNAAAAGDGRSTSPFNSLSSVNNAASDADAASDYIYLFTGNAAYTTGLVLENNQQLIGNGVALVVPINATPTTLRAAGTRPTLSNGTGNALTFASNNTVQGLNLTAAANAAIFGSGISGTNNLSDANITTTGSGTAVSLTNQAGTFNYSGGGGSSISGNSSGTAVLISGGNGNITFFGVPISQNSGRAIDIQTRTGGTVSFENGSTVTETAGSTDAVVLRNNTGGSVINFSNNVNLTTNAGRGLYTDNSTGSFTLNMNAAGNNINATGGAAIDVEDIIADLDFQTLTSTNSVVAGGSAGVRIVNLSNAPVGRSVTVTGATTVTNSAATGVIVQGNAAAITFATLNSAPAAGQIGILADTNSGTTTATAGTITATDAIAVSVLNSPLIMTLTSVSANNTGDSDPGVSLNGMTGTLVMSGGSLVGGNAQAFFANAQNGSITYNGTISQANAFRLIEVTNKTGGTVNFGGALTATGANSTGIRLNANGNTTFNFTGGMNLSTGVNDAFTATGGGTVNITQNNGAIVNTLTTTTGTALNVTSTNIGASGLTFRSINSTGASAKNGVILNTTGTTAGTHGGLTITGNGGTCSSAATCTGGNIANKNSGADASTTEGTGIYLKDARDVNLTNVFLNDFANYAIYGSNVTNFTFTTSRITGSNGTSSNPINEGCIRFDGLLGNALITGSNIGNTNTAGGATNALHINNASGTLTLLDIQNSTIFNQNASNSPANSGQDAVFFGSPSGATGTMNLRMNNTLLTHARQFLMQVNIQGTKTANLEITNNTLHNQHPSVVNAGGGSNITGGGTDVYVKYLISGNSFRHTPGVTNGGRSLTIGHASGSAAFDGRFINNTIGQTGVVSSGAGNAADGLGIFASGNNSPSMGGSKALIQGNTIQRYGEAGILVNARQGSATLDVTILGNIIREPGTAALGAFAAIWVNSGALAADTNIVNLVVGSATVAANKNTMTNSDPSN